MFARVTLLQFQPDKADEGFDIVQNLIVPSIKEQNGFKGLLLLRDPKTGSATTITLWASEADMAATATGNYPNQVAKLTGLLSAQPTRDIYEVEDVSI